MSKRRKKKKGMRVMDAVFWAWLFPVAGETNAQTALKLMRGDK